MKFAMSATVKRVVIGCVCATVLAAVACAEGPTGPSASAAVFGLLTTAPGTDGTVGKAVAPWVSASSPRSGDLHVTKECSEYHGAAGDFCTITASNVKAIEIGTRVVYAQAAGATALDSDVVLDTPGPGNNKAFGHCHLEFATLTGLCTFSGGTGKFTHLKASANVSCPGGLDCALDGTYSFSPRD